MPWSIRRDDRCPVSRPYGVVKDADNELEGCHATKEKARAQQAALYASERSGSMSADDDGSGDVLHFEFPAVDVHFEIDRPRRRISGMVVPWNKVASSGGYQWRFERGSIGLPVRLDRIKLLRDHDMHKPVGKALGFDDREDGLWGEFYVMQGPTGDEVLAGAADGILDGFSVGPSIDPDAWEYDSARVRRVFAKVPLVETTITAYPSFDDARVASVRASRKGAEMAEKDDGKGKNAVAKERGVVVFKVSGPRVKGKLILDHDMEDTDFSELGRGDTIALSVDLSQQKLALDGKGRGKGSRGAAAAAH